MYRFRRQSPSDASFYVYRVPSATVASASHFDAQFYGNSVQHFHWLSAPISNHNRNVERFLLTRQPAAELEKTLKGKEAFYRVWSCFALAPGFGGIVCSIVSYDPLSSPSRACSNPGYSVDCFISLKVR